MILSYDPNLRLPLWPSAENARDEILSIWDAADIIKVFLVVYICVFFVSQLKTCLSLCFESFFCVKVSEEEIEFLTKGEDPYDDSVVRKLFHPELKLLLVTEGPEGCRYYTKVCQEVSHSLPTSYSRFFEILMKSFPLYRILAGECVD